MADWTPTEVALVIAAAGGLITAVSTSAVNLVAVWRLGTKIDGMLVQRDASNVADGERIGRKAGDDASAQRAEGRRQEREAARESPLHPNGGPVPVADDRTAAAAERSATATERVATATEDKKP